jgi:hypothetical protein
MKSSGSADHLEHYTLFVPGCLFPRTFLGLRLLDLIDEDAATTLSRAGLPATWLPNRVSSSTCSTALASGPASLKQAQQRAHPLESVAGVFRRRAVGQCRDEPGPPVGGHRHGRGAASDQLGPRLPRRGRIVDLNRPARAEHTVSMQVRRALPA